LKHISQERAEPSERAGRGSRTLIEGSESLDPSDDTPIGEIRRRTREGQSDDEAIQAADAGELSRVNVYLDLNHWYALGRAAAGTGNADLATVYEGFRQLVQDDAVRFPLSALHYMELTENPRDKQRAEAGVVMAELSQFKTLAPMSRIIREEMRDFFYSRFGRPFRQPVTKVGFGVGFAFGEPRELVLKGGSDETRDELERRIGMSIADLTARLQIEAEYFLLIGPTKELRAQMPEYDPYAARRIADEQLRSFHVMVNTLRTDPGISERPLDAIAARELAFDVLEAFTEVCIAGGFAKTHPFHQKEEYTEFLLSLPSRKVSMMMKYHYLKDVKRDWTINDLRDVDALSVGIPYCDAVATDRKAWDVTVNRARLDKEFDTRVFCTLQDLAEYLGVR
jgi:hypothetical protein